MDRKSWLWRRKNSVKSPSGETESSGSLSSHSERFSDEHTASNPSNQSPEVTSKAADGDQLNESVKSLSTKLSEALAEIHKKEESVKQHAKVAEEAVSGWERSENEVLVLKKQVEGLTQNNSTLEERVGHLDGALKECLRQLRQAREEQEETIYEALVKKNSEWESKTSQLEKQLVDIKSKLEAAEKENSILNRNLLSKSEELELMVMERDLSTRAAESASKQRLDILKKVAKLEAECRRLKTGAQKAKPVNDQLSVTALSSTYVESVTETGPGSGEKMRIMESDLRKKNTIHDIGLMDDFLEMEKIASSRDAHSGRNNSSWVSQGENRELEAMMKRTSELEDKLVSMDKEKTNLVSALNECQILLKSSEEQLKQAQVNLVELSSDFDLSKEAKILAEKEVELIQMKLLKMTKDLDEAELKIVQFQNQLTGVNEEKVNLDKLVLIDKEKLNLETALNECQIQLKSSEDQLKQTQVKLVELSAELAQSKESKSVAEKDVELTEVKLLNLTKILGEADLKLVQFQNQLTSVNEAKRNVEVELKNANVKNLEAALKLKEMERELQLLRSKIRTLEEEVIDERNVSSEAMAKCKKLESEISKMKSDSQVQRSLIVDEFRINQDEELAVAANKFAECQKTIASLGRQLKSLANFEDLLIDSERPETVL